MLLAWPDYYNIFTKLSGPGPLNRHEIENANRICVLAGDFFMATASTQLAELEEQHIVKEFG